MLFILLISTNLRSLLESKTTFARDCLLFQKKRNGTRNWPPKSSIPIKVPMPSFKRLPNDFFKVKIKYENQRYILDPFLQYPY